MKYISAMVAGVVLSALAMPSSTQAQTSQLGWVATLGGACWQGVSANGAQVDRQCFQIQFNRFLRTGVTRADGFGGAAVLGFNETRHRLEMYAWSNQNEPAIYTPEFDHNALTFAEVGGRVIWRTVDHDSFQIVRQTGSGATWSDHSVITYHRDGAAPAAREARSANSINGSGGFGWLDSQAGHCFHQIEPQEATNNRGCLGWEYPHVLRQTWYWGGSDASGETVMFKHGVDVRFFYWDAQGNFGMGASNWLGQILYSVKDADPNRRTSLRHEANGFSTTTEARDKDSAGWPWVMDHSIRLRRDD